VFLFNARLIFSKRQNEMAGKFVSDKFFIKIWDKNYRWINEYQILVGAFWPIALSVSWAISLYALLGEGHPSPLDPFDDCARQSNSGIDCAVPVLLLCDRTRMHSVDHHFDQSGNRQDGGCHPRSFHRCGARCQR
jgi:hypothetical protein